MQARRRRLVHRRGRRRQGRRALSDSASTARSTCPIRRRRFQPEDVFGPSEVIDHGAYAWRATDWRGRPWQEAVIIEAHVGTFTPEGTYRAMIDELDHLVETGITALELMPLADFAGSRNWGYDGVLWYAPDSAYGRPDDLKALIDAAHLRGLMVLLDVVYNHFGPEGNYLGRYAPSFFTDAHTPWGSAIDYRVPQSARLCDRERAALAARLSLRRPAARRRACDRRAGRVRRCCMRSAPPPASSPRETGRHIHLVLENDDNRASHSRRRRTTRRGANIARSGTTTIITPGTC